MKTGKVRWRVCAGMLVGGLILPLSVGAVNEPLKIEVTIKNSKPTCNVSVSNGGIYNLGEIKRERQEHPAFSIKVNCDGDIKTRIKANASDGVISSGGLYVSVGMGSGDAVSTSDFKFPRLRLMADGRSVRLRDSDNDWFCTASTPGRSHECNITPMTVAKAETLAGKGSATVAFTIDYFL